ncbi:MAG: glycosyltransferase [Chitinophagaceae bacterium]|nr:MAG: glycosyltransferase [Chitinophagaceae bacterium]
MRKLAIVVSHPIQYYAPVFKALASSQQVILKVFYTWGADSVSKFDPDFGRKIEWDLPLLDGYDYTFLDNVSSKPGTSHFRGIITPNAVSVIDKFEPDAILVYGWAWQSHLQIIRHFSKKKPVWFRGDSTLLDNTKGLKSTIRSLVLRWIYKKIDLAFYVGTQNRRYFEAFGLKENQLKFAPHSIDNDRFSIDKSSAVGEIRNRLGISPKAIVILFAGKLEPKKDPFTLLEAFLELRDPNVHLLFVGNGVLESELKERSLHSIKNSLIHFMDFQNQGVMPAIYQTCELFCLPSFGPSETWGLAVNEAMAAGTAVLVSTKVGCSVDLVCEEVNGSIFEAGNKKDLSEKLAKLTVDVSLLKKMGDASAKIIENWSFEHQIIPILDEVQKL